MDTNDISPLRTHALTVLTAALKEQRQFVKAHAAEALIRHGRSQDVYRVFLREQAAAAPPYRVVAWRVLALSADGAAQCAPWEERIRAAALDPEGSDRPHAIESWAKLRLRGQPPGLVAATQMPALRPYARWALAATGGAEEEAALADLLSATDPLPRMVAAYALMRQPRILPSSIRALESARSSTAWARAALHVHVAQPEALEPSLPVLLRAADVEDRRMAATAMVYRPCPQAMASLTTACEDEDADVRIYAADAVLQAAPS